MINIFNTANIIIMIGKYSRRIKSFVKIYTETYYDFKNKLIIKPLQMIKFLLI